MNNKFIPIFFLFLMFLFNYLDIFSKITHAIELLLPKVENSIEIGPRPFLEYLIHITIILVIFFICLFVNKWLEIWKLPNNILKAEIKKKEEEIDRWNIRYFKSGTFFLTILTAFLEIDAIEHSFKLLGEWFSAPLFNNSDFFYSTILFAVVWLSIFIARSYWFSRLRDIDLPVKEGEYNFGILLNNNNLVFRHINGVNEETAKDEIIKLESSEKYGEMGNTDIEQVFKWWKKYPDGNWLAVNDGKIIGGIDAWPVTKDVYDGLLKGKIGEDSINEGSLESDKKKQSYWYIASISLDERWQKTRKRKAILIKMLSTMIRENFIPAVVATTYPVRLVALIWTTKGRSMASNAEFKYIGERSDLKKHVASESIYEIVFNSKKDILDYADRCEQRLGFKFTDSQGKAHRLNDYKGKWVLVYFLSIEDQFCLNGIRELTSLYLSEIEIFAKPYFLKRFLSNGSDIQILGVAIKCIDKNKLIEFTKDKAIPYPMIPGYRYVEEQFDELAAKSDTYYLFDRDGKLALRKNGFSKMEVESLIKK